MAIDVLQLTDIHFLGGGEPMFGRDADETLAAVLDDVRARGLAPDIVVATGDLVHDGSSAAYRRLATALSAIGAPVYCLAGNHDDAAPFDASLANPCVHIERFVQVDARWAFGFVDTNRGGRAPNGTGALIDRPDRYVSALHGEVDEAELDWLERTIAASTAEHIFLWMHHPPIVHPRYALAERSPLSHALFPRFGPESRVRAVGTGHLHCPFAVDHEGVTIYCTPSTWLMMDFETMTFGPPGYRWFRLHDDGRVESQVHLVDDPRFAERAPLSPRIVELMTGDTPIDSLLNRPEHEILASLRNE